jgi:hypothetical protein
MKTEIGTLRVFGEGSVDGTFTSKNFPKESEKNLEAKAENEEVHTEQME